MSIAEGVNAPGSADSLGALSLPGSSVPSGTGLPDPALLTRLANEIFASLPLPALGFLGAGADASAATRPAHDQVLEPDIVLEPQRSQGASSRGGIPLPFEAELAALVSGLIGGREQLAATAPEPSSYYFLQGIEAPTRNVGAPTSLGVPSSGASVPAAPVTAPPGVTIPGPSAGGFGGTKAPVPGYGVPDVSAGVLNAPASAVPSLGPGPQPGGATFPAPGIDSAPDSPSAGGAGASPGSASLANPLTPEVGAHSLGIFGNGRDGIVIPGSASGSGLSAPGASDASAPSSPGGVGVPATVPVGGGQAPAEQTGAGAGHAAPGLSNGFNSAHPPFDIIAIRRDFPILRERVNGRPLIWFDNAATTQKPAAVIDRLVHFYEHENSNIHRAAHELAARATDAYEGARKKIARFLNASSESEIVFQRGTTEAINLVANTFGRKFIGEGDEIVITHLEHHANIVPWQLLCLSRGAKLRVAPVDDHGQVILEEYGKLLGPRTRLAAFTQVSNALGTITPVKAMVEMAHRVGARVLVDGAQSVSHMKVDVQDLDADFFVFSGHKLFGPTGIGALYGKKDLLEQLPPWEGGGNMIKDVTFERTQFHGAPLRFEAGTGNIADAVGLGAAIDYVERIGLDNIGKYEHGLLLYATERLKEIPGLRIIGTASEKASVISLVLKGVPSEEVGSRLNQYGIAVRSGHHCAQPILRRFGQETTVRPSFAFYNTCAEIDVLVEALHDIQSETGTRV